MESGRLRRILIFTDPIDEKGLTHTVRDPASYPNATERNAPRRRIHEVGRAPTRARTAPYGTKACGALAFLCRRGEAEPDKLGE